MKSRRWPKVKCRRPTWKEVQAAWMAVFTIAVIWYGVQLSHTQSNLKTTQSNQRQDRIDRDTALAKQAQDSADALKKAGAAQAQALRAGEILVCTKALGTLTAILSLSVAQSNNKLTSAQRIILNQYFSLTDPKQCAHIVNQVTKPEK